MPSLFPDPPEPRTVEPKSAPAVWANAHCDGGARGNPGPSGYGAVIQDDKGLILAELSEFLGHRTNNFAEYSGLLGCLQWAIDNGYKHLRVVSDSELMVKQIQGKYKVNSPDLKPLWEEAKWRISKLDGFQISHALRHKNKAADRLANAAMDRGVKNPDPSAGHPPPRPKPVAAAPQPEPPRPVSPAPPKVEAAPPRPVPPKPVIARVTRTPAEPPTAPEPGSAGPEAEEKPAKPPRMLRGFARDGVVHLLGGERLSDGVFVKIIVE